MTPSWLGHFYAAQYRHLNHFQIHIVHYIGLVNFNSYPKPYAEPYIGFKLLFVIPTLHRIIIPRHVLCVAIVVTIMIMMSYPCDKLLSVKECFTVSD